MSETKAATRIEDPFRSGMQFEIEGQGAQGMMTAIPSGGGDRTDVAMAQIVTAQRVAVKRNIPAIVKEARMIASAAGGAFFYSIPFKEKKRDGSGFREVRVEGASIDCAMAALNCYGNCSVEAFPAKETQSHWTFMARLIDYEKGVTFTRSFNQRKSQNTGMKDAGRAEDIIFQIGQSKAIRNVIVGGLKWLCDEMFQAAKESILGRIEGNPDGARKTLIRVFAEMEIDIARVENVYGRKAEAWLATDMAKIWAEAQSIRDGFSDAADLYPIPGSEEDEEGAERARADQAKHDAAAAAAAKKAPAAKPKAETKPPAEPKPKPAEPEGEAEAQASEEPEADGDPDKTNASQLAEEQAGMEFN